MNFVFFVHTCITRISVLRHVAWWRRPNVHCRYRSPKLLKKFCEFAKLQTFHSIVCCWAIMAKLAISRHIALQYLGGKSGLTDTVCCKRLLYMVGFLRPPATTSGWTTFPTSYYNSVIQDGVQDGRRILKCP